MKLYTTLLICMVYMGSTMLYAEQKEEPKKQEDVSPEAKIQKMIFPILKEYTAQKSFEYSPKDLFTPDTFDIIWTTETEQYTLDTLAAFLDDIQSTIQSMPQKVKSHLKSDDFADQVYLSRPIFQRIDNALKFINLRINTRLGVKNKKVTRDIDKDLKTIRKRLISISNKLFDYQPTSNVRLSSQSQARLKKI